MEAEALPAMLARTPAEHFDRPTICSGWSVRDVLAHCGAALTHITEGTVHRFTPEDNERDVEQRRSWDLDDVIEELVAGYHGAAQAIDRAGGTLDGVGLGEWIHGGDVREALDEPGAYKSAGVDLAVDLLVHRSRRQGQTTISVTLPSDQLLFGPDDEAEAELSTDVETFVRLCSGRRPDPDRYQLAGCDPSAMVLFR